MAHFDELKKALLKALVYALLALFLIPTIALLFVEHAESARDQYYLTRVDQAIEQDQSMLPANKANARQHFHANPPSSVCDSDDPALADYRADVCAPYSELWQYSWVEKISWWTLIVGAFALIAMIALGAIAFVNRQAQYLSFVIGWTLLRIVSAVEVLVQGTLLVWLSFWITAFFFERYFLKLIVVAAVLAGGAALLAIVGIFKRPPRDTGIAGELISEKDAPLLWANLRGAASKIGTAPPDQVVAGIDVNFFVTEAPLTIGQRTLSGRSLFVSLPLLRILDRSEADAVLAHELAHFRGGDTASSAALGPKLVQYDHYCHLMRHGGSTIAVFHLIYLYRLIFEWALRKDSREREFLADRVAAKSVSASAIVTALIKVAAYARYRSQVEQELFSRGARHDDQLGIANQVAAGLAPYATSAHFTESMRTANVPHPFDSHPSMIERMRNVGVKIEEHTYGQVVTSAPAATWVSDIGIADAIEQKLWADYERQFAAEHERSLAYRYEPATDAERAIVVKYFPPLSFALKRDKRIGVAYAGLVLPEGDDVLSWDLIADLKYTDGMGGDVLQIVHHEKGLLGAKTTKVKLPGIAKQRDQLKGALGYYWQRHKVMRQQQSVTQGS